MIIKREDGSGESKLRVLVIVLMVVEICLFGVKFGKPIGTSGELLFYGIFAKTII